LKDFISETPHFLLWEFSEISSRRLKGGVYRAAAGQAEAAAELELKLPAMH